MGEGQGPRSRNELGALLWNRWGRDASSPGDLCLPQNSQQDRGQGPSWALGELCELGHTCR